MSQSWPSFIVVYVRSFRAKFYIKNVSSKRHMNSKTEKYKLPDPRMLQNKSCSKRLKITYLRFCNFKNTDFPLYKKQHFFNFWTLTFKTFNVFNILITFDQTSKLQALEWFGTLTSKTDDQVRICQGQFKRWSCLINIGSRFIEDIFT